MVFFNSSRNRSQKRRYELGALEHSYSHEVSLCKSMVMTDATY
jgi:hypothetical protein